jgi:hypothetical protein
MEVAFIAPTKFLPRYCQTGYHLALAHQVLIDSKYAQFYLEQSRAGAHVILDNSVIELGYPLADEDLVRAAKAVEAREVVIPDKPGDKERTLRYLLETGPPLRHFLGTSVRLMAVPQGRSADEWLECMETMLRRAPGVVNTIGIGKFLKSIREEVIIELDMEFGRVGHLPIHDFHLLGTWGNPIEIRKLAQYDWIRGVDTKLPVRLGLRGTALHPVLGMLSRIRPEPLLFEEDIDAMPHITAWNCYVFETWARDEVFPEELQEESKVPRSTCDIDTDTGWCRMHSKHMKDCVNA